MLDERGRLLRVNEPDGEPAPRFFLGRTAHGNAWWFGAGVPDDIAARLNGLAVAEPVVDAWPERPRCGDSICELLGPIARESRGPAYVLPPQPAGPYDIDVPSTCYSSRVGRLADEAGVETPPAHRGRGFAPIAVAAWARRVQAAGKLALYSTGWENRASQRVAEKLSARLFGEDWHVC